LILPRFLGNQGIYAATPLADSLGFTVTMVWLWWARREEQAAPPPGPAPEPGGAIAARRSEWTTMSDVEIAGMGTEP
jgi:hypothetical protein